MCSCRRPPAGTRPPGAGSPRGGPLSGGLCSPHARQGLSGGWHHRVAEPCHTRDCNPCGRGSHTFQGEQAERGAGGQPWQELGGLQRFLRPLRRQHGSSVGPCGSPSILTPVMASGRHQDPGTASPALGGGDAERGTDCPTPRLPVPGCSPPPAGTGEERAVAPCAVQALSLPRGVRTARVTTRGCASPHIHTCTVMPVDTQTASLCVGRPVSGHAVLVPVQPVSTEVTSGRSDRTEPRRRSEHPPGISGGGLVEVSGGAGAPGTILVLAAASASHSQTPPCPRWLPPVPSLSVFASHLGWGTGSR